MDRTDTRKKPLLSKSRFLAGLQCPLRLWYQCYEPQLACEVSPAQQALFDTGHQVGHLATGRSPGGILIEEDHRQHAQAVRQTAAAINRSALQAIFEAAFTFDGIRIRVDVLQRRPGDRWNLVEVKSSTGVKDVHVWDVALQYHVLDGCGLQILQAGLMHLNNAYVLQAQGPVLSELFRFQDLTDQGRSRHQEVAEALDGLRQVLAAAQPPEIAPSRHCKTPYLCEFWEHCTAKMPENWVLHLSGISQSRLAELSRRKITDICDIPGDFPLTEIQDRIRTCVCSRQEYVSPAVAGELKDLQHPIHFLDFETVAPAVPRYPGTRPYQVLAFQFSDHVLSRDGSTDHHQYLCREDKDPREAFTAALLQALGTEGSIVIYTSYEKDIVRALMEQFPKQQPALQAIIDRMKDLHAMVKSTVYHPGFKGSFSLKRVLPALVPEMDYGELAIQDGSQASVAYLHMIEAQTPAAEKETIAQDLLRYCEHDTLAMIRITEALLDKSTRRGKGSPLGPVA